MFQVEDYRWLATSDANQHWQQIHSEPAWGSDVLLRRLRTVLPVQQASLLMEQFDLVESAKRKVSDPAKWFWTRQLLEQSSDEWISRETALDLPRVGRVWDICCGAGADSISIASRGLEVTAVDRDPIACELVRQNARSHGCKINVLETSAEAVTIDASGIVHIDPDRRADGRRSTRLEGLSPGWSTIASLLERCSGMSLKLAPGTRVDPKSIGEQIERLPDSVRFLARDGSVRQQRWYWGLERWPRDSITASMRLNRPSQERALQFAPQTSERDLPSSFESEGWFHETFLLSELPNLYNATTASKPARLVGDYDPSLRAAGLGRAFAGRYGWQLIDSPNGYLTTSTVSIHPMVRWFEVMDVLPLDLRKLKSYSKQANVRSWELKSRGLDVDLQALRKALISNPKSDYSLSVLCTKVGKQYCAIFGREVQ